MVSINLGPWARINITELVNRQTGLTVDGLKTAISLGDKMSIPESETKDYHSSACPVCNVGLGFDVEKMKAAPVVAVELENAEAKHLKELLEKSVGSVNPAHYRDWYGPTLNQLASA